MKNFIIFIFIFISVKSFAASCNKNPPLTNPKTNVATINNNIVSCEGIINSPTTTQKEKDEAKKTKAALEHKKDAGADGWANEISAQQNADLRASQKQASALKQMSRNNKALDAVAILNGAASVFFFSLCKPPDYMGCVMGITTLGQVGLTLTQKKNNSGIAEKYSGTVSFPEGPVEITSDSISIPQCVGSSLPACKVIDYAHQDLTAKQLPGILGCPECIIEKNKSGDLQVTLPNKIKITSDDIDKFSPEAQSEMTSALKASLAKNPAYKKALSGLGSVSIWGEEEEEEYEEEDDLTLNPFSGKFSGGNGVAVTGGSGRNFSTRKKAKPDDFNKQLLKMMTQQKNKLKKKKHAPQILGKDMVGAVQDDIFTIITRRYRERKQSNQFIKRKKRKTSSYKKRI